jgi:hypothetical protein
VHGAVVANGFDILLHERGQVDRDHDIVVVRSGYGFGGYRVYAESDYLRSARFHRLADGDANAVRSELKRKEHAHGAAARDEDVALGSNAHFLHRVSTQASGSTSVYASSSVSSLITPSLTKSSGTSTSSQNAPKRRGIYCGRVRPHRAGKVRTCRIRRKEQPPPIAWLEPAFEGRALYVSNELMP